MTLARLLKWRAYEILITGNNLTSCQISVASAVPELIFVLDRHRETRRMPIAPTMDFGQHAPLPNDCLLRIILGDLHHGMLQFSRGLN